jgi:Flp pilus assembly CpaE family ATPase
MDAALLEGFITVCKKGMHLLSGLNQITPLVPTAGELARLFDLLVTHYRYVVVDCSGRVDDITRMLCDLSHRVMLVAHTDVVALWSASRMHNWLDESGGSGKLHMVLNRYKKIPGFTDEDIQKATSCKVLWKVPNQYHAIAAGIDRGDPVLFQDTEISRSIRGLAAALAEAAPGAPAVHDEATSRKKAAGGLLISPLRAGQ